MPYRRTRMNKRKRVYKKKPTVKQIVHRAIKSNIELKEKIWSYDSVGVNLYSGTAVSYTTAGYGGDAKITCLARAITNGTGEGQRIGHKITIKGVHIRFAVTCASTSEPNNFRMVVYRPKGQASITSIDAMAQQLFSNYPGSSTQWCANLDTDFAHIYWDKSKYLAPYGTTSGDYARTYFFKKFIRFPRGLNVEWSEANSIPNTDIWVAAISDSGAVNHPGCIAGQVKMWYTDA